MNKLTILAVLLFTICCNTGQEETETIKIESSKGDKLFTVKNSNYNKFTINDKEYTLYFEIENENTQKPILVISIELHNGSYYISPFSKRDATGKFYIDLGSYTNLDFEGNIIEIPRSVEKIDGNYFANLVHVNTIYKQALQIKSQEDFEVFGRVRFTIEPRCTLETIPFAISYKNGVMTFIDPKC